MSKDIYVSGEYFKNNPTWDVEDSEWKANNILKIIRDNELEFCSICDIGCGAGGILEHLYKKLQNEVSFQGYDISPQAIELCQGKAKDRLRFEAKPIDSISTAFDIVLVVDVLEHIADYINFLNKIRTKGLYKIFHIPLEISVQAIMRVSPILKYRKISGHIHYFTKELAIAALVEAGYDILDYFYTAGTSDLPAKSFASLLAKLPRKLTYALSKDIAARVWGGYSIMVLAK